MLEFLVDNFFLVVAGKVFRHIVGHSIGKNFAHLLADIFLHSYEAEVIQSLLSTDRKQYLSSISNIDTSHCPLMIHTLRIISVRCIPVSLRSKTWWKAIRLISTWILSCQSGGTDNLRQLVWKHTGKLIETIFSLPCKTTKKLHDNV